MRQPLVKINIPAAQLGVTPYGGSYVLNLLQERCAAFLSVS